MESAPGHTITPLNKDDYVLFSFTENNENDDMNSSNSSIKTCTGCGEELRPAMTRCRNCGAVISKKEVDVKRDTPRTRKPSQGSLNRSVSSPTNTKQSAKSSKTSVSSSKRVRKRSPEQHPVPTTSEQQNQQKEIRISCECGKLLRVKANWGGKRIKCPACSKRIEIPNSLSSKSTKPIDTHYHYETLGELLEACAKKIEETDTTTSQQESKPYSQSPLTAIWIHRYEKIIGQALPSTNLKESELQRIEQALVSTGRLRHVRSFEIITSTFSSESLVIRSAAARGLGELGTPSAVAQLIRLLDCSSDELRRTVIESLGTSGDTRAIKPLLHVGIDRPRMKHLIADTIVKFGEEGLSGLLDVLSEQNEDAILQAITILGKLKSPKAIRSLLLILHPWLAEVRSRATETLGTIGDKRSLEHIIRLLKDPDDDVRKNAADALGKMPDVRSVRPLIESLNDQSPDVLLSVAHALAEIEDPRACSPLYRLISNANEQIMIGVTEALARLGDQRAVEPALKILKESDDEVKIQILPALHHFSRKELIPELVPHLDSKNTTLRRRIIELLGKIKVAVPTSPLETMLKKDPAPEVRSAAAKSLGEIGEPISIEALQEALSDEFSVCCQAVIALGKIGNEAALPSLFAMLKDPTEMIRVYAASALGEIGHTNAVKPLEALLIDSSERVRRAIAESLRKIEDPHNELELHGKSLLKKRGPQKRPLSALGNFVVGLIPDSLVGFLPHLTGPSRLVVPVTAVGIILGISYFSFHGNSTNGAAVSPHLRGGVESIAFSPDGKEIAVARSFGYVEIWDSFQSILKQDSKVGICSAIEYHNDPGVLILAQGPSLKLWDSQSEKTPKSVFKKHNKPIYYLATSQNRETLYSRSVDGNLLSWDLKTLQPSSHKPNRIPYVREMIFSLSPDGKWFARGGRKGDVALFERSSNSIKHKFQLHKTAISSITFSPDRKWMALGTTAKTISLYDLETGNAELKLSGNLVPSLLKFQPDSKRLIAAGGNRIEIWNLESKDSKTFPSTTAELYSCLSFSPDGKRVAAAGEEDQTVWIFDTENAKLISTLDARG